MRCGEFQKSLLKLTRGEALAERAELLDHAGSCVQCSDALKEGQQLSAALSGLKQMYQREQASQATAQLLLEHFRERRGIGGSARPGKQEETAGPFIGRTFRGLILATSLLLACGITIWVSRPDTSPAPPRLESARVQPVQPPLPMTKSPVHASPTRRPEHPPSRKRATRRAAVVRPQWAGLVEAPRAKPRPVENADSNQVTSFFSTMYPTAAEPDYGLQLVRVELPRRTMMSFGLPVDPRQLNSPVKADLIVGPDGLTRAIRFVQ